jgi:outer membrane lipopolysaccharide assembly protein LptE/RlpB
MSNHLGDTNKMVSDTPRTDEAQFGTGRVSVSFARTLERELNAANVEVERLTKKVAQLYEGAEEQNDRIKRLEEAGDAMDDYILDQTNTRFIICAIQWREAKEAKL